MLALANDYRLYAPDTPGMGLSDPVAGEMTIDALADGIVEFLDISVSAGVFCSGTTQAPPSPNSWRRTTRTGSTRLRCRARP